MARAGSHPQEADYEAWRRQRDWPVWKDRMHGLALPLPTQRPQGSAWCFCGEVVTKRTIDSHIAAVQLTFVAPIPVQLGLLDPGCGNKLYGKGPDNVVGIPTKECFRQNS